MAKKDAAAKPTGPLHPPYFEMICEAIATLKDRRGSSQPAIAKLIQDKYEKVLPPNFKKVLSVQLKKFVKSERLFKVKNSYKISSAEKLKLAVKVTQKKKKEEESSSDDGGGKKKVMVMKKPKEKVAKNIAKKGVRTKSLSQVKTPDAVEKRKVIEKKLKELSPVKNPDALNKKKKKKSKAAAAASSNSKPNKKKPMK